MDSLEIVRQLFANDCLRSAHWHRFVATVHSPVGRDPRKFGIRPFPPPRERLFAENGVAFKDSVKTDHDTLGRGLHKALYNYMHGIGIEAPVTEWFDVKVPPTKIKKNFVRSILASTQA